MLQENPHYIRYAEALKDSFLFNSLETKNIYSILNEMKVEKWKSNSLKKSIDYSSTLHFIVSGRLKIFQVNYKTGREHTIFILTKGDVFDVFNLLDTEIHDVFWEPLDDLEVLKTQNDYMRNFISIHPELNAIIFKYLGKRMRMLEETVLDASMNSTLTRLSNLLLKHININSKQLEIINNLPNDEIASLIGTTRAVVSRHIQELKKAGAISVKRKHIDIENLQTLISIAEEKHCV